MQVETISRVGVAPRARTHGTYAEVTSAVLAIADTEEGGVQVTGVDADELKNRLIPSVRRSVSDKLHRKLVVGEMPGQDGVVVLYVGGPVTPKAPGTKQRGRKPKGATDATDATEPALEGDEVAATA